MLCWFGNCLQCLKVESILRSPTQLERHPTLGSGPDFQPRKVAVVHPRCRSGICRLISGGKRAGHDLMVGESLILVKEDNCLPLLICGGWTSGFFQQVQAWERLKVLTVSQSFDKSQTVAPNSVSLSPELHPAVTFAAKASAHCTLGRPPGSG